MLRRKGAEPYNSKKFYCAVIQAVPLFGADRWVLLAPMTQRLEGFHVGLLRQVRKLKAKRQRDGSWRKVASDKAIQGEGTQLLQTYLDRRKAAVP